MAPITKALSAVALLLVTVSAQYGCDVGPMIGGNCYTSQSCKGVQYTGVGSSGSYDAVTTMDDKACSAQSAPVPYSGPLAPFDQELTCHIRGPVKLKRFAVYMPSDGHDARRLRKRHTSEKRHHHKRHNHAQFHKRGLKYTTTTEYCTSTVWVNGAASPTVVPTPKVVPDYPAGDNNGGDIPPPVGDGGAPPNQGSDDKPPAPSGGFSRISFYDADGKKHDNLVFANNMGGQGSGKFSYCFGNSLSYMNADGSAGASDSTCLEPDVLIPSNKEFSIWQGGKCEGAGCGFAYGPNLKGFGGCDKTFVMEFTMPDDGKSGVAPNGNMPAIWFLNSRIPRVMQYAADKKNSCWNSGCGEVDCFEVLSAAAKDKLTSHIHGMQGSPDGKDIYKGGMGTPHWISRPMGDKTVIGVVSMQCCGKISISIIGDSDKFDFGDSLDQATIDSWHLDAVNVPMLKAV